MYTVICDISLLSLMFLTERNINKPFYALNLFCAENHHLHIYHTPVCPELLARDVQLKSDWTASQGNHHSVARSVRRPLHEIVFLRTKPHLSFPSQSKKDERLTRTRHRRTPLQLRLVWPEESCALLSSCPYLSGDHVFIQSPASGGLWSPSREPEQWGGHFAAYGLFFHRCQISLTKGTCQKVNSSTDKVYPSAYIFLPVFVEHIL